MGGFDAYGKKFIPQDPARRQLDFGGLDTLPEHLRRQEEIIEPKGIDSN